MNATPLAPHAYPRPANFARASTHAIGGVTALAMICLLPSREWLVGAAGLVFVAAWTMEITRRLIPAANIQIMRVFQPIAHPHEQNNVNSATWYSTALFGLALLSPMQASAMAVTVLGFADPVAAIVGRRWGTVRLRANRSLQGCAAFLLTALAAAGLAAGVTGAPVVLVGVAAIAGTLAELFSTHIDDNFTIPVAVAVAVTVGAQLLQVPIA